MAKQSIAIDMDDTVADTLSRHVERYQQEFGIKLNREDMLGKKIYDVVSKEHLATVRQFPHHPDFFNDLPVLDDAVDVIKELSQHYRIYFASAAMEYPSSFNAKYAWLKTNFPFINELNFIFCGYKGMLNCDFLIDDSSCHIDVFSGTGYLFNATHNYFETGYNRVNSWLDVKEKFLG